MQPLKELLESAVGQATFDAGRVEKNEGGLVISYASRPQELVTPKRLSQMIATKGWHSDEFRRASSARLIISDEAFSELECHVRSLLQDYVEPETDRIGKTFPIGESEESYSGYSRIRDDGILNIHTWSSPVSDFTRALVKGAAVVGPEVVVRQLQGWLEGDEPVKYRTATILNGVAFTGALAPLKGIHTESLPLSAHELPVHLPQTSGMSARDYVGRTALYIDHEASPALFRPGAATLKETVKVRNVAGIDFDIACEALSLESNTYVDTGVFWCQYEGLQGLTKINSGNTWSYGGKRYESWLLTARGDLVDRYSEGVGTLIPDGGSGPLPSEERLCETLRAIKALGPGHTIRRAISRWMKSRNRQPSLADRYIDLRIALEALYLKDFPNENNQEMGLRLALFGAWHLGDGFKSRKIVREELRLAYREASKAVHRGFIVGKSQNRKLLDDAQEHCHRGILKLLREGPPTDWGDLILGAEYSGSDQ